MDYKTISFNGLNLISCNFNTAASIIISTLESDNKKVFFHVNMYNYYLLYRKSSGNSINEETFTMFFEGIGMKLGAALVGKGFNPDINGTDLYPLVLKQLEENKKSCFLLGAEKSVNEKSVGNLRLQYPELRLNGFHHGFFKINDEGKIIEMINSGETDLLVVGMGALREIDFVLRNFDKLNVRAIWCVGGLFDFISQQIPRAPGFVRKIRFEWLFRFMQEPGKKFNRILFIPLWFYFHILKNVIINKIRKLFKVNIDTIEKKYSKSQGMQ